jgi:single-strand DNA-binding protein
VGRRNKNSPPLSYKRQKKEVVMINKVMIEGRLMKDVQIKVLPSGKQVAKLTLVYSRKYQTKNKEWKEEINFFDIDIYSPALIEKAKKLQKGDRVIVEGMLKQERWTTNNKSYNKVRIKASRIQLISKPKAVALKTEKK